MLAVLKQVRNVDSKGTERWYAKERYAFENLYMSRVEDDLPYFSGDTEAGEMILHLARDERLLVFTEGMARPFAFEQDSVSGFCRLVGPVDF